MRFIPVLFHSSLFWKVWNCPLKIKCWYNTHQFKHFRHCLIGILKCANDTRWNAFIIWIWKTGHQSFMTVIRNSVLRPSRCVQFFANEFRNGSDSPASSSQFHLLVVVGFEFESREFQVKRDLRSSGLKTNSITTEKSSRLQLF